MYTYNVSNTENNRKIADAIKATFSGIKITIGRQIISFETRSDAAILSIKAAYQNGRSS